MVTDMSKFCLSVSDLCHSIFLIAVKVATNLASTMDRATDVCFFDPQDTAPWSNMMMKLEMDFLSICNEQPICRHSGKAV